MQLHDNARKVITSLPTYSVGKQTSDGRWRLSSSVVVCNTPLCNATHQGTARDGGPVVLRPVRAIPCLVGNDVAFKLAVCVVVVYFLYILFVDTDKISSM